MVNALIRISSVILIPTVMTEVMRGTAARVTSRSVTADGQISVPVDLTGPELSPVHPR